MTKTVFLSVALLLGSTSLTYAATAADCANLPAQIEKISRNVQHLSDVTSNAFRSDAVSYRNYYTAMAPYAGRACVDIPAGSFDAIRDGADIQDKNANDIVDYNAVIQKRIQAALDMAKACATTKPQ